MNKQETLSYYASQLAGIKEAGSGMNHVVGDIKNLIAEGK